MTDPLPRPTITADTSTETGVYRINVTASRDGRSRAWAGVGSSAAHATRDLVEKIFEDHHSAEYVKLG